MATVTYLPKITEFDRAVAPAAQKPARKGWFARFVAAIHESRSRQAEHEIKRHRHLLPDELERAANRLTCRSEDALPFVR